MRASTLFTVASLFLIGSYSLPQPENLGVSRTIEDREAKAHTGAEWWEHHKHDGGPLSSSDGSTTSTNATKIKEREAHREKPSSNEFSHHHDGSWPTSTNSTKTKERRQGPLEGDRFTPPDGMTWMEFMKHMRHKGGSHTGSGSVPLSTGSVSSSTSEKSTTSSNSTKVKMMKFRD